jgi:hypothetical protein
MVTIEQKNCRPGSLPPWKKSAIFPRNKKIIIKNLRVNKKNGVFCWLFFFDQVNWKIFPLARIRSRIIFNGFYRLIGISLWITAQNRFLTPFCANLWHFNVSMLVAYFLEIKK